MYNQHKNLEGKLLFYLQQKIFSGMRRHKNTYRRTSMRIEVEKKQLAGSWCSWIASWILNSHLFIIYEQK